MEARVAPIVSAALRAGTMTASSANGSDLLVGPREVLGEIDLDHGMLRDVQRLDAKPVVLDRELNPSLEVIVVVAGLQVPNQRTAILGGYVVDPNRLPERALIDRL